jgi:hypothetical protein
VSITYVRAWPDITHSYSRHIESLKYLWIEQFGMTVTIRFGSIDPNITRVRRIENASCDWGYELSIRGRYVSIKGR